ncbi:MAG: hypothetical protein EOM12_09020 [Verrucomicrobiae bacterium]|nr:hypothetical protein [Verrucomicrobiae bacterium]
MSLSEVSVKTMLEDLMNDIELDAVRYSVDFVKSLNQFFKTNGHLTEKQEAALRKIYRGHMGES